MVHSTQPEPRDAAFGRLSRFAWLPIPLLLAVIAGLWVADLRTVYESQVLMVLLNLVFTWLASLCVCILTARGFLASGQLGLLMFGCGSLLWGITSLAAAVVVNRINPTITIHNLGVLGAGLCHLTGLLWHGRMSRPGRWLVVGYAGALLASAVIFRVAMAGLTPPFFVQGHGGTSIRWVVLLLAIASFAWVAWRILHNFWRQPGTFYYWYGLGLALVATGLTGVVLLSVQGGILGWVNRLTQYLGSAYLLVAAYMAARNAGSWAITQPAVDEPWRENVFLAGLRQQSMLGWMLRYGLAITMVAVTFGLRVVLAKWVGPSLPLYIFFYPAVMLVALLAGLGPGLVATAASSLTAAYWFLPPVGQFNVASQADRLGLVIFAAMGVCVSVVSGLYRSSRDKAAAYDRQEAVRESQARLATFAGVTFEGIVESEAGQIVDCNEQLARMLGYSVAELRGMDIAALVPAEDRDRAMAGIRQGRETAVEHGLLCKDGTRIFVETHGRPVSLGSARRHTAIRDITERRNAESVLQNTLRRFYHVLSSMYSGVLLMTDEGRVEFVNQAFCDAFGLKESPADVVGMDSLSLLDRILPSFQDPDEAAARGREILQRGQPVRVEEFAMRDGRTALRDFVPLEIHGTSCGRVWIYTDITDRKRAEESLRQTAEELARSNKDLEQFSYIVSHDLQEPLRAVTGVLQMLDSRFGPDLNPKAKQYVAMAVDGSQRMSQLIQDLLDYSRIQGKAKELAPTDMKAVFEQAKGNCLASILEAQAAVTCDDLPTILGDQTQLVQLLQNLIGNAIKFRRPEVPPEVHISVRAEGETFLFQVRDNGIGIPADKAERIFQLFQRLHSRQQYPGTGIGLAVCKKIVERHGGRIWVESKTGEETTFFFTIPSGGRQ